MLEVTRIPRPSDTCPECKRRHTEVKDKKGLVTALTTWWVEYKLIPDVPAAGCRACGHVVYLKSRPV